MSIDSEVRVIWDDTVRFKCAWMEEKISGCTLVPQFDYENIAWQFQNTIQQSGFFEVSGLIRLLGKDRNFTIILTSSFEMKNTLTTY